ncbi:MAG TPA: ABC transporter ATP-binding protein [Albidovulum sp.]|uniref:ABC transporter ATP-binding protein n=1 Tax=Albidovulum sp. TaxID=1872424 RepID=UPI002D1168C3|nr:ABC transporter ATP-binding protein [Albidovulum sp.]
MAQDRQTYPGDSAQPKSGALSDRLIWRLMKDGFRTQGWTYAIAIVAMCAVAATSAMTAWVMEAIIDALTEPDNRARVTGVSLLVMAIFFAKGVASYVQSVAMAKAGNRIVAEQQLKLYRKLMQRGVAFFSVTDSSDILLRVTQSAQRARALIDLLVSTFTRDLLTLIGLVGVMFYQQPLLSAASLIVGPVALLGIRYIVRRVRGIAAQEMTSLGEIMKVMQETAKGIRVIKIFALEPKMKERMDNAVRQVEARSNAITRLQSITGPLMETLSGFAIALVVWISALGVLGGEPTTPGQLMSFVTALLMAYDPAKRLMRMRVSVEQYLVGVRMMFELLDQEDVLTEAPDALPLKPGPGAVEFRDVGFSYEGNQPVLGDVTTVFAPGKTTALIGPSGSGKSTLLNLVMRLYDPESGAVLVDGQDLRGVTFASLRDRMSFVGQDTFLFSTSVRENIRVSRPDASEDEIVAAARAAHAHEFIETLPQGYDTPVGENGAFLSGGQRQRLSIARAILRRGEILLLDEATSALDATSEAYVKDALKTLTEGVTTIVIAHRLSTIIEADRIVVMDQGRIVESGTAAELLQADGMFRDLFQKQFGGAELVGLPGAEE